MPPRRPASASSPPPARGGWVAVAWILAAGMAAHCLCLGADFFLDDEVQIVQSRYLLGGEWWGYPQRAIPYFTYWLTYAAFGMSAPAFHFGNLIVHLGIALVLWRAAPDLLRGWAKDDAEARRWAFWAAILFAVHPMASEPVNYARCRAIEFVTLFTVLAAWCAARGASGGRWKAWVSAALACLAAFFPRNLASSTPPLPPPSPQSATGKAVPPPAAAGSSSARGRAGRRRRFVCRPGLGAGWLRLSSTTPASAGTRSPKPAYSGAMSVA
ncbi:MAG: hypothetical protein R3F11_03665 [Verrucomicrobiales bacterium]